MEKNKKIIFFAYKGRGKDEADENVDAICKAIQNYNIHQSSYEAKPWEAYRKTTAINIDILNAIKICSIFACDLTYFNHNVLFELGFAIGKSKEILILLNESIGNAALTYKNSFLKNIRYTPFINANDILKAFTQKEYEKSLLEKFVNIHNLKKNENTLLYIQSKIKNQASLDLTETIEESRKEKKFLLITSDSLEVSYKPMNWYFQNIFEAKGVIIHFLGENVSGASEENAKNSFLAGFSCGLEREVLLAAPSKYKAPLDYHDILIQYIQSSDLISYVIDWLYKLDWSIIEEKIEERKDELHELNLVKLGIGCEVAEYEKEGLLNYFVETSSYNAALNQKKSIIIGRKGVGKSAIYIKVLNEIIKNKLNFVVDLKPEPDEILQDVEMANLFRTDTSKKSFFISVWKLIIFSRLIKNIYEKIKSEKEYIANTIYEDEIIKFVDQNSSLVNMNVYSLIKKNCERKKETKLDSPEVLEILYNEYLSSLIKILKAYFKSINLKYCTIIIVTDSLDKAWQSNIDIQSELIVTLFELENKIKNDLSESDGQINVNEIIFLRKDIFDYILKKVAEPDKLITVSHEINWEEYPSKLKDMIANRFKFILNLESDDGIEKTWKDFFEFKDRRHPFEVIEEIVTRRPRDVIYFMSRLFESAINKGHKKVNNEDLTYAIETYTMFLNQNLFAETRAEYPEIDDILTKLQKYHGEKIEYRMFSRILDSFKYTQEKKDTLVKTLFEKDYMIGFDIKQNKPFSDLGTLKKKLKEKKFFFFPNKVYVIAHAKYYFIKHRQFSPF